MEAENEQKERPKRKTYKDDKAFFEAADRFRITAALKNTGYKHIKTLSSPCDHNLAVQTVIHTAKDLGISGGVARVKILHIFPDNRTGDDYRFNLDLPVLEDEIPGGVNPEIYYLRQEVEGLKKAIQEMKPNDGGLSSLLSENKPLLMAGIQGFFALAGTVLNKILQPQSPRQPNLGIPEIMPLIDLGEKIGYTKAVSESDDGNSGPDILGSLLNILQGKSSGNSTISDIGNLLSTLGNISKIPTPAPVPESPTQQPTEPKEFVDVPQNGINEGLPTYGDEK